MDALRRLRAAFDPAQFRESGHDLVDQLADYLEATISGRTPTVLPWTEPEAQLQLAAQHTLRAHPSYFRLFNPEIL